MWRKLLKIFSLRHLLMGFSFVVICGIFYILTSSENKQVTLSNELKANSYSCNRDFMSSPQFNDVQSFKGESSLPTRQKALVFFKDGKTQLSRNIIVLLESARFKFHKQTGDVRSLPVLIDENKGRYAVIIFEDMSTYLDLHHWNRETLDKYCRDFSVGVVTFLRPSKQNNPNRFHTVENFPIEYSGVPSLIDYELNASASMLRIARSGGILTDVLPANGWATFETNHETYQPVSYAVVNDGDNATGRKRRTRSERNPRGIFSYFGDKDDMPSKGFEDDSNKVVVVMQDIGLLDGVQRVIFGGGLNFWLHKVLFLDALGYLSQGKLMLPLERYMQIDIDDGFIGLPDTRMTEDDVMALIDFQKETEKVVPGFQFFIGFSGKFIFKGNPEEEKGDHLFLKVHQHFNWFPHMWSHMQAHWFNNASKLCKYMSTNYNFAVRHHLNTSSQYAVAPHHAGIFPVHDQLYQCWREVWNITSTSTEEYPHLRPDHKRRGFIHEYIRVLPRQTCGLFTHTMILEKYPGGKENLHTQINGGELFLSFLYNQVNIFMTHLSNYGNDRLGIYTFQRAIQFVQCWTNLRLLQIAPNDVAHKYFELYPDEKTPIWLNPCLDKRHMEIWAQEKTCERLPEFVVVGPQKTGTTALYWFLNMHPDVQSNRPSEKTFEEVQFFSSDNYLKGIDWYMDYFPLPENDTILFEKSATYFDQSVVPKRLTSLLPKQQIVVILIDPAKRAYSWYQHMRSHEDETAMKYSFNEVVRAKRKGSPAALISLQRRCIDPGMYAQHLEYWMEYMPSRQIVIVDGEMLKDNPITVMKSLQVQLDFKNKINYEKIIVFDKKKGFYCQLLKTGKTKCLGRSKGRQYPDMDKKSEQFLSKYYLEANQRLLRLLKSMNKTIPNWLIEKANL